MLVLLAGLWQPCLHELTVLVLHEFHLSIHREPVGMNIPQAHEDGNHQALIVEVRSVIYFFYYHNLAVCRSYYELLGILYVQVANRAAVEIEHDAIYHSEDNKEYPERYLVVEGIP